LVGHCEEEVEPPSPDEEMYPLLFRTPLNLKHMGINRIILRLWTESEIDKLTFRSNIGMISQESADTQIKLLKKLMDDFNLEELNPDEKIFYHDQI